MLRTARGAPACDSLGRVHSRTDDEFLRAVAAAVDSDDKVLRFAAFCLKGVLCAQLWRWNPVIKKKQVQELRGEVLELQANTEDVCEELRAVCCDDDDD